MSEICILGIDPGLANTGFGIIRHDGNRSWVVDHGCILTHKDTPKADRLKEIYDGVRYLIDKHSPDAVSLEQLFFSINVKTAMAVGEGRGAAILATAQADIRLAEYTPQEIKQAVTGSGKANKLQVQRMVRVLLNLDENPETSHAADALAAALCHAHSLRFESAVKKALLSQITGGKKRIRF